MKTHPSQFVRSASAAGKIFPAILFAVLTVLALTRSAVAQTNEQIKWNQPPAPLTVTSNLFYGWNEPSVYGKQIAADDWVCTTTNPVTALRWWGSFLNWQSNTPPKLPAAFNIAIWTDVPAGPTGAFSHPGQVIWRIDCTSFTWEFVGWDYDPRMKTYEACFRFDQNLLPEEWFYQAPGANGTNIFWISIAAVYSQGEPEQPFGWKTRPRDLRSPAPDDAVRIMSPNAPDVGKAFESGEPIWWPTPEDSWDLAFELISSYQNTVSKWEQPPDLQTTGLDVNDSVEPQPPYLLADDFQCTATGPLTDITIWGSWYHDLLPGNPTNVIFTLSIHSDIPAQQSPTGYSMPGAMLWMHTFQPGQFGWQVRQRDLPEGWLTPPAGYEPVGDYVCHQYDFHVDPTAAFVQQGLPTRPVVYWLDVQARPIGAAAEAKFGWKTSVSNWNDAAVWVNASEPYVGPGWQKLIYPPEHPRKGDIGLSFRVATEQLVQELKWSQPPAPYTPPDAFNGWNEYSVYGYQQIVADDWVCTNANPVTDIHWWGSYLGWGELRPPQVPDGFHIAIWTDVPRSPNTPFSHPGQVVWETLCTNFTWQFVGWDIDPRDPAAAPEACFKFDQQLSRDEWFHQDPANGTNIYWISIAAVYRMGTAPPYPWGWKTRPRDQDSPAPDDAVKIFLPVAPHPGSLYEQGEPLEFPKGVSWDAAFVLTTQPVGPDLDFGDAPDPRYPTLLANNGARHIIVPGVFLGNRIDAEPDGQPNATATGDDLAGIPDEDGVVFTSPLVPGQPATVRVTASVAGRLNAWIDFNDNLTWADPGEQIFVDRALNPGPNMLAFLVPAGAQQGATTFARFRFNTAGNLGFTGLALDGEVEDYQVKIEPRFTKYIQYPDTTENGMDVLATSPNILADDFICTNRGPITDLHIWASWLDDKVDTNAVFWLGIWTDVPQTPSHPGRLLWSSWFRPGEYQARPFAAADERFFDPNSGTFLGLDRQVWQYDFFPKAAFLEEGTPNTPIVYWVSVTAVTDKDTVFGWKTSTNHFNDDAVFGHLNNGVPMGDWRELRDPVTQRSLDLAFAITTIQTNWPPCPDPKLFVMPPETAPSGLDVLASSVAATVLADDFICTNAGWITNIIVWGSWSNDLANTVVSFQLGLWSDVAATNGEPSHPGQLLASRWFRPGEYRLRERLPASESFYDPNLDRITGGDTMIHGYEFLPTNVFWQTGSLDQPKIYWLSVIAQTTNQLFGWKTSLSRFQDAAVFGHVDTNWTAKGDWRPMRHPTLGHPLDLAFSIATDTRVPVIQRIVRDNNLVVITWTACPGSLYRVQYRKNLEAAGWNDLPGDVLALGTSAERSDLITYDRCFYRVLLLP